MAQLDDFLKDERLVAPRRPPKRRGPGRWIAAALLLVAAIATGIWVAQREQAGVPAPKPLPSLPEAVSEGTDAPQHPIAEVLPELPRAPQPTLPPLAASDAEVLAALAALLGLEDPAGLFVPRHLVPRIVATIDNLPQRRLATRVLPLKPVPGALRVDTVDGRTLLAPANSQRYARHVRLLEAVDTEALVGAYVHYYPLFQQAYRDLGYPDGHFNDRLVAVIDHLLAAPEPAPVLELRPEKSVWAYADPALEQASAGHRLLFRLGPEHAARVKAKLREIRAAVAAQELAPASAPVPAAAAPGDG